MKNNLIAIAMGFLVIGGVYFFTQPDVQMDTSSRVDVIEEPGFKGLITPVDFEKKIESAEYVVLDVRTPQEYNEQRIGEDALLVNFYDADFAQQLNALDKTKKYLVHCRSGGRSSKAVKIMEELGFKEFYELQGGISAWNRQGLDVFTGEKVIPSAGPDTTESPSQPVVCTEDARQCPDGSFVGRTGSSCEFVCP